MDFEFSVHPNPNAWLIFTDSINKERYICFIQSTLLLIQTLCNTFYYTVLQMYHSDNVPIIFTQRTSMIRLITYLSINTYYTDDVQINKHSTFLLILMKY